MLLTWDGKRKPDWSDYDNPRPAVLRETFGGGGEGDCDLRGGLLFEGDNLAVMARLLADGYAGKVQLAYLDPPFGSGANYVRKIRLRGDQVGRAERDLAKFENGSMNQLQYTDQWSESSYLQFMYERLWMVKELLADNGSLYLHLDSNEVHAIKLICDEIFGRECFQRQIIWRIGWISGYKSAARNWIRNHDTILFYCKDPGKMIFNKTYLPYQEGYLRRGSGSSSGKKDRPAAGKGYPLEDTWNCSAADRMDSIQIKSFSKEKTSYPTQKNESLLERIILASSNPGDLVMDVFAGSGTTAAVAQKTGRRWIACDANHIAVQTINRRLQAIIGASGDEIAGANPSFSIWEMGGAGGDEGGGVGGGVGGGGSIVSVDCRRDGADVIIAIMGYSNLELPKLTKTDWRSLIEWVSLDRNYDGRTFNVYLSDIPKDIKQYVSGRYTIPNVPGGAVIALKVIDILGHETLWVK